MFNNFISKFNCINKEEIYNFFYFFYKKLRIFKKNKLNIIVFEKSFLNFFNYKCI